ncbi:CRAL/TRIO domain-containing protein [Auriculariales sp. MPI-PUGE-AT-0066]|nr:CRAL/TRIO domain-containing protein [Auriculariales sp. MPI-PUGE-AT-0066]
MSSPLPEVNGNGTLIPDHDKLNSLSGHLGHLDDTQQASLGKFKEKLQAEKLWTPAPGGADPKQASHDDGTLLRFLRARKFSVDDAMVQFRDTEEWRERNNMKRLYECIDIEDYEETRRLYPQWTGRRDKRGVPVYVFRVADLDARTMAAYERSSVSTSVGGDEVIGTHESVDSTPATTSGSDLSATSATGTGGSKIKKEKEKKHSRDPSSGGSGFLRGSWFLGGGGQAKEGTVSPASKHGETPAKMLRLFALYENLTRFVMPLCSIAPDRANPQTPITQSNNIVDITGVGLRQFWNLRSHMQDASQLATAHYPETLDRIFVIGAPSFFPTVWSWIKKWFDPITVSKVFILPGEKAEVYAILSKYIDDENIPTQYGGKMHFQFGDMPSLDKELSSIVQWGEGAAVRVHQADTAEHKTNGDATAAFYAHQEEKTLPHGPIFWERSTTGPGSVSNGAASGEQQAQHLWRAIGVGSVGGTARRTVVATLAAPGLDQDGAEQWVSQAQLGSAVFA